jgi:DNA-binding transcriptional LysR family regulator
MGRRLDALEEHLGVKLLVRTTRRITLTHEGSAFLEDCQRLLADLANAEASVSAPAASRPAGICASPRRPALAAAMWRRWCRAFGSCTPR